MIEKLSHIAEQAVTNASRRQFLDSLGRGALAAAAAVGGLLALPHDADAAPGPRCPSRTFPARCRNGSWRCCPRGMYCYTFSNGKSVCRRGG
jgi:hypothetical protein